MKLIILNKKRVLFNLFVLCLAVVGFIYLYNARHFNPDKILQNSVLKEKNFSGEVIELSAPNGIKAYLLTDKTNPIISFNFIFQKAGGAYDEVGKQGLANLVSAMLTQGAGKMDNQAFKEVLEKKAIGLSFGADMDDFTGSLLTTVETQAQAYELLHLVLTQPRFDAEELLLAKQHLLVGLQRQTETPRGKLELKFKENAYGSHPYARNSIGVQEDLLKVSAKELQAFVKNKLVLENLIVGISGDISEQEAIEALEKIFKNVPSKGKSVDLQDTEVLYDGRKLKIEAKSPQNVAIFANEAVSRLDIDFYPLYVVNHIFGGAGLSSRLSLKARENEALTYGIYTYLSQADKVNMIRGGFSATPENYDRVVEIVTEEWQKLGQAGVSQQELDLAKNYLISSYNLRFASIDGISQMLAYMQKYDLGIDFLQKRNEYVKKVDLKEANRVARKYYDNQNMIWFSIGEFAEKKN
ncbi:MAG: pitrilysin family protein [Alphaproteobacteria bacterium]|nr:pitrilysin family protein [Alphaproteobacteria bacterium]